GDPSRIYVNTARTSTLRVACATLGRRTQPTRWSFPSHPRCLTVTPSTSVLHTTAWGVRGANPGLGGKPLFCCKCHARINQPSPQNETNPQHRQFATRPVLVHPAGCIDINNFVLKVYIRRFLAASQRTSWLRPAGGHTEKTGNT